jgi:hypothetical protein
MKILEKIDEYLKEGSIFQLEDRIKDLRKRMSQSKDPEEKKIYAENLKKAQARYKEMKAAKR